MSRDTIWQLNDFATLDVVEEDTEESTPVAGLQDVSIVPQEQIEILYTADSTKIADRFSHEKQVAVDIGFSFWDGEIAEEWLGGAGQSAGTWEDTSDPQLFELTGDFRSRDGSQAMTFTIPGITFEEMPLLDASRGEYAQWDLTGIGEDVEEFDVDTPPA